jgi:hypothetical protein
LAARTVTRTLTAEHDPIAREDARRLHQLILIESMVRDGYSEREIADAVSEGQSRNHDGGRPAAFISWARRLRRPAA